MSNYTEDMSGKVKAAINPVYINNITEKITACPDCSDLSKYMTTLTQYFEDLIKEAISNIGILKVLITIPTDLSSLIDWVTALIGGSFYKPYIDGIAQVTATISAYSQIMSAVTNKISSMSCIMNPMSLVGLITNQFQFSRLAGATITQVTNGVEIAAVDGMQDQAGIKIV
jgi:hypothetical protein